MASEPKNQFEHETDRDFDDIERITRTFVHYGKAFLIILPLWLILLVLFPRWGLGGDLADGCLAHRRRRCGRWRAHVPPRTGAGCRARAHAHRDRPDA